MDNEYDELKAAGQEIIPKDDQGRARRIYPAGSRVEWAKATALIDIAKSLRVLSNRE